MGQRVLLILNAKARQGKSDLTAVRNRLREADVALTEQAARSATAVSSIIRDHARKVDAVMIGGGDGTLNAAAAGLYEAQLPFAILPLGTANDLARTLGVPTDLTAAAEVFLAGNTRRIDLGRVNDNYFFNASSLGMSVRITRKLTGGLKSRWGVFAYVIAAAKVVIGSRPFMAEIVCNGETVRVKTSQIVVGNGRHFGGGLTVDVESKIDDGILRLYSLELRRWWNVIPLIPSLIRGTLKGSSHVRTMVSKEFDIRTPRKPRWVNTDGEITTMTPARFRVIPLALTVYCPPEPPS